MRLQLVNNADTLRIFEFERANQDFFSREGIYRNPMYYQYNRFIFCGKQGLTIKPCFSILDVVKNIFKLVQRCRQDCIAIAKFVFVCSHACKSCREARFF